MIARENPMLNSKLAALMFSGLIATGPVVASDARAQLDAFADGLIALTGRFEQRVFSTDGALREQSMGDLALKAPRMFRWQYETPYEQLVVADGTHVWLYDVDLEQVTVKRQADQEAQSPLVVLTDPASLDTRYTVTDVGNRDGLNWLRLEPVETESEFRYAELGLDADGLRRMHLEDSLGGRTQIDFSDWQRNPDLSIERFQFVPPKGVDVVGETEAIGEVRALNEDEP